MDISGPESEYLCLHFFTSVGSIGPVRMRKIMHHFGTARKAYEKIGTTEWQVLQFPANVLASIERLAESFNWDGQADVLKREGIILVADCDTTYPELLRQIHYPPPLLYVRGNLDLLNSTFPVAIIGTRSLSAYGKACTEKITAELVRAGCTIVSGLALGIDALAHETALAQKGPTVAILGSGLDDRSIYPRYNFGLARRIIDERGLLISQFPPGTEPLKHNFPLRNRLISGMTRGTLVIEAAQKSGSLITAYAALEQNRDVFAMPGSIFSPTSAGTNLLIQKGAKLVLTADDILTEFSLPAGQLSYGTKTGQLPMLTDSEQLVLSSLNEPADIDVLIALTEMPPAQLLGTITTLELKGLIRKIGSDFARI